jgi:hypothetical protein
MPSDHGDGLNNGNNRVPPDDMKNQKNAGRVENWPATRSQDDALSAEIKGTGNEQHSTQTRASRKSNRKGAIIDKTQIPGCEGITTAFDDKQSATTEEIPLLQQSTSSGANLTLVSKGDATKPKSDVSVLQKIKDKATDIATGVSNTVSKYKSKRRRKKEQKAKKRRGKNKKTQRNGADNDDDDDEELSLSELSLQDDTTKAVVEQHTSENARKSSKCEAENYSSSKPSAQNEQQLATRQSRDQQETKPGTTGRQKSYAEITRADGKSKGTSTTSENAIVTSEASKATSKDAVQAPGDMADVAQKPDPAKNTPGRTVRSY